MRRYEAQTNDFDLDNYYFVYNYRIISYKLYNEDRLERIKM